MGADTVTLDGREWQISPASPGSVCDRDGCGDADPATWKPAAWFLRRSEPGYWPGDVDCYERYYCEVCYEAAQRAEEEGSNGDG